MESIAAGPTAAEPITQVGTPEQLSAAREARGWSRSDIAAKLGMMPRQIEAIEQGRWEALPGHAFVRGAIRAYGKTLQVDVAPLLATLGARAGMPELRPSSSLDSPLPRHGALGFDNGGSGSRIVWILLGIAGVVAIAMYFGRGADFAGVLEPGTRSERAVDAVPLVPGSVPGDGRSSASPADGAPAGAAAAGAVSNAASAPGRADTTPTPEIDAPAASPGAEGATRAPPSGAGASIGNGSAAASGPATQTAAGAAGVSGDDDSADGTRVSVDGPVDGGSTAASGRSAGSATEATAGASSAQRPAAAASGAADTATPPDAIVLRFEQESWVEVRDGTGRVLLLGTQPANSTRELVGPKPYSMTIGNANFVRVEHQGRDVDLGAVTQRGVARIRVE